MGANIAAAKDATKYQQCQWYRLLSYYRFHSYKYQRILCFPFLVVHIHLQVQLRPLV